MNLIYENSTLTRLDIVVFQVKQIVREMSEEQRQYSQNLFVSMAKSDDFFHPREYAIIEQFYAKDKKVMM